MGRELIYRDEARSAVLHEAPGAAYCIDRIKAVDAVETVYADLVDAEEYVHTVLTKMCSRCKAHMLPTDNVCPGCGAIMRNLK